MMNVYLENDLLTLNSVVCHYGVPNQKWGKHDSNRRWQRHAVYAKGRPDPNVTKLNGSKLQTLADADARLADAFSPKGKSISVKEADTMNKIYKKNGVDITVGPLNEDFVKSAMKKKRAQLKLVEQRLKEAGYTYEEREKYAPLEQERRDLKLDLALSNTSSKVKEKVKELVSWRTNENLPILKGIPGMYRGELANDPWDLMNTISAKKEMIRPSFKIGPVSVTTPANPIGLLVNPAVRLGIKTVGANAVGRMAAAILPVAVSARALDTIHSAGTVGQTIGKLALAVTARRKEPRDEKTGFRLKTHGLSRDFSTDPAKNVREDSKKVNPWFGTFPSGATNASNCIVAMEMRRRGYDVMAQAAPFKISDPREKRSGISMTFKDAKVNKVEDGNIAKALSKQPEGSRGVFFFNWKFTPSSGHAFYYSVNNGKITITDPQSGRTFTDALSNNEMKRLFATSSAPSYARLDDCDFILDQVKKAVF